VDDSSFTDDVLLDSGGLNTNCAAALQVTVVSQASEEEFYNEEDVRLLVA